MKWSEKHAMPVADLERAAAQFKADNRMPRRRLAEAAELYVAILRAGAAC